MTLIHTLVYISVFGLVLGIAIVGFHHWQTQSRHLQRNAEDIGRVLHAGELWREEVRSSAGAELLEEGDVRMLRLGRGGEAVYFFFGDEKVWRRSGGETNWTHFLEGVRHSEMRVENRHGVRVCRWELELKARQKTVRVKPTFTFMAVPGE